jgi:hypothetical protein
MMEIDQIAPMKAKYHVDLIGEPWGTIANTVNLGFDPKPARIAQ